LAVRGRNWPPGKTARSTTQTCGATGFLKSAIDLEIRFPAFPCSVE
jgi:hypothetical protein